MAFRKVESNPHFPSLEQQVQTRWAQEGTFEQSLQLSAKKPPFVLYDGPPFPTGAPHPGTLFVSAIKDIIGRYKTMRGYYVPRMWGWDCHGLPIETIAEKNLGIAEKNEIEKTVGVAKFNAECRRIVSQAHEQWRVYINKIGRWVTFEDPYTTMSKEYMESVIWGFAEAYKKGLIYQDFRVTPYCTRCQTPLSLSETRQDDATRSKQSRSATVKLKVAGEENLFLVIWTTTPWTLPGNLAVAVGAGITYAVIQHGDERLIIAESRLAKYESILEGLSVIETLSGQDLVARNYRYEPLFRLDTDIPSAAFSVIEAEFVTTEDGTGLVHLAPAFGEDDYWACRKNEIGVIDITDSHGHYTAITGDLQGLDVHLASTEIIKRLKSLGILLSDSTIEHNYPHCWRCREPLIYKSVDAWYLSVEKIKEQMLELNSTIEWHPADVREGRFGQWLAGSRDWNISRNRFWATPIPVWKCSSCNHPEVLDSLAAIEGKAGRPIEDLHKEVLDTIEYPCAKCAGTMIRTPEVLDCWFESGSMPFAHRHYPFADADGFKSNFPADLIVEATGQLRGWFYSLHVLSTCIFGSPAFKACKVLGTLLAGDGKKLSKSAKNYTDCIELIDSYGADALRCYFAGSVAVEMGDLVFRDEGVQEQVRTLLLPMWNALTFFTTYAEIDRVTHEELMLDDRKLETLELLDRFILAQLEQTRSQITEHLDAFSMDKALKSGTEFLDVLNNWYIRRNRARVWENGRTPSKVAFFSTLYLVLRDFSQLMAPLCPFLAEGMWSYLRAPSDVSSVHLAEWPEFRPELNNQALCDEVNNIRALISAALSIRAKKQIRVRQPLASVSVAGKIKEIPPAYQEMIKEELNVKEIIVLQDEGLIAQKVVKAKPQLIGPRLGGKVQVVLRALKEGRFTMRSDGGVDVEGEALSTSEIEINYVGRDGLEVATVSDLAVVALDLKLSEELIGEGYARDLIRHIQEFRKECEFDIADRIELSIVGVERIMEAHSSLVAQETLCVRFGEFDDQSKTFSKQVQIGEGEMSITMRRVPGAGLPLENR
jgi:isoleucyl-tRNA synthetase